MYYGSKWAWARFLASFELSDVGSTRDGHVKFWRTPRLVPSLSHLSRVALRCHISTHQVMALPIPNKIKDFLTYRNLQGCHEARCGMHQLPAE